MERRIRGLDCLLMFLLLSRRGAERKQKVHSVNKKGGIGVFGMAGVDFADSAENNGCHTGTGIFISLHSQCNSFLSCYLVPEAQNNTFLSLMM